jgi:aspartokinase
VVGVSGKEPYRPLQAEKFMLNRYTELPGALRAELRRNGMSAEFELPGFDTITFFVAENEAFEEQKAREAVTAAGADAAAVGDAVAMIGIVGEGIGDRRDLTAELFLALRDAGVAVRAVNMGGSPVTLLLAVDRGRYAEALNCIVQMLKLLD